MKNAKGFILAVVGTLMLAAVPTVRAQQANTMPDPSDNAKLYELAKQEGKLVFYHGAVDSAMRVVTGEFEKKYPEITVTTIKDSGVAVYQRFAEETNAHQYIADVVQFSDYPTMVQAVKEGLYASWKVPNYDDWPDVYKIGTSSYAIYLNDVAIAYNVNKVTPEEVKLLDNWSSLADPRFKGRTTESSHSCATCYASISLFLDPKMKEYGVDFLKRIAANKPGLFNDPILGLDRVVAGDYAITMSFEGALIPLWEKGAPIRWVHPKPTPLVVAPMVGVSATAPHPAAARLFLNWITSPEGAVVLQKALGAITGLPGVPDQRPVVKEPWYSPITDPYHADMVRWTNDYDSEMATWDKILKQGAQ